MPRDGLILKNCMNMEEGINLTDGIRKRFLAEFIRPFVFLRKGGYHSASKWGPERQGLGLRSSLSGVAGLV